MKWNRNEFIKMLGLGSIGALVPSRKTAAEAGIHTGGLIKPPRLKKGDTIGMISPGSRLPDRSAYDMIIGKVRQLGFRVKEGKYSRREYGNLAGSDRARAADLNNMFSDPDVDAIMPFRGGWGSNRILDRIDYGAIAENPKALIGFSDITSLLLAIYAKTGLVTFHGPVGKSEWTTFTKTHFKQMLMEDGRKLLKNPPDAKVSQKTIYAGKGRGRLLGGNLTVITSMMGSEYLPAWEGSILFLEDIGEEPYRIDRMITQLKLNGILSRINGFIFSRCTNCKATSSYSLTLEQILKDHIEILEVPSFYGSMIGHIDRMFTLPMGVEAEVDAVEGTIRILETPTTTRPNK